MNAKRPDLVEAWDVTSKDPLFLIYLKQVRNSVPVPRHWA
jgi:splicing factor 3B subunit 2